MARVRTALPRLAGKVSPGSQPISCRKFTHLGDAPTSVSTICYVRNVTRGGRGLSSPPCYEKESGYVPGHVRWYGAYTSPNGLQNFPAITFATTSASTGETRIDMFLDTAVSTAYTIRFYSNPRDTGEGKTFIGQVENVTTNGTSSLNDFIATRTVPVGQSITATATDPAGNTSEFTGEARSVRPAP
jgi:hypothetical protein